MFGSTVLDVVTAVVFIFLGVSLAASAITEAIASTLKLRHDTLRAGVGDLLNDPDFTGLARTLYAHALVNPLSKGLDDLKTRPAYIHGASFALALLDILKHPPDAASPPSLDAAVTGIADPQLRQVVQTLLRQAAGEEAALKDSLAAWFDSAMERVSGTYKRNVQWISFVVAFIVAALLNADVLHAGQAVWQNPSLTAGLSAAVSGHDMPSVQQALDRLDASSLLGWSGWTVQRAETDAGGDALTVLGWAISAAAALFGAPFWFDSLQRIAWIKGVGERATRRPDAART